MNVTLPPQLEALVLQRVDSGRYDDASDAVQAGLRLLDEHDRAERSRAALGVGLEEIERGEGRPLVAYV